MASAYCFRVELSLGEAFIVGRPAEFRDALNYTISRHYLEGLRLVRDSGVAFLGQLNRSTMVINQSRNSSLFFDNRYVDVILFYPKRSN